jgi:hypothetical protein
MAGVVKQIIHNRIPTGKTYSLFGNDAGTEQYYKIIKALTDLFLRECRDEKKLLSLIQKAGARRFLPGRLPGKHTDHRFISFVRKTLKKELSAYTTNVKTHLRGLPLSKRFDSTLSAKEAAYHLFMLEIELVNRMYREAFRTSAYKFALLPHCLRDFRPSCQSVPGDVDEVCRGCTENCFINLGSELLKQYSIRPYISVVIEQDKLFRKLKKEHPSIGALGIACIPELARGMRLCIKLGISPVGIPLDANRCARWMKQCRESSFSLKELEELLQ